LLAGLAMLALALAACAPVVLTPNEQGEALIEEVNGIQGEKDQDEENDEENIVKEDAKVNSEPVVRYESMTMDDGAVIEYALVLPAGFDARKAYPVLLALPPGPQTREMVQAGLDLYWRQGAIDNGWVVVSPASPDGTLYFQGAERYLPAFLAGIATQVTPEGGKYHVAGISNGGISAFRLLAEHPELVHSLLVAPGYPFSAEDRRNLLESTDIPVAMFVGEQDATWIPPMQETADALAAQGREVSLEIVPGEGHVIRSLSPDRLFALLESFR
jgi:pimeloyl-ACP methyl ester carboxylesterase